MWLRQVQHGGKRMVTQKDGKNREKQGEMLGRFARGENSHIESGNSVGRDEAAPSGEGTSERPRSAHSPGGHAAPLGTGLRAQGWMFGSGFLSLLTCSASSERRSLSIAALPGVPRSQPPLSKRNNKYNTLSP